MMETLLYSAKLGVVNGAKRGSRGRLYALSTQYRMFTYLPTCPLLPTGRCEVGGGSSSCGRMWCCSGRVFVCDLFLYDSYPPCRRFAQDPRRLENAPLLCKVWNRQQYIYIYICHSYPLFQTDESPRARAALKTLLYSAKPG